MPRYLADTSAWNRSTATLDRWAVLLGADEIAMCPPVRLELLCSARGRAEYTGLRASLEALQEFPLDERAIALAERTQATLALASQHRGPKVIDLLVAGIAEASGAILLHYDRHFDAIARVTGQPTEWLARRGSLD